MGISGEPRMVDGVRSSMQFGICDKCGAENVPIRGLNREQRGVWACEVCSTENLVKELTVKLDRIKARRGARYEGGTISDRLEESIKKHQDRIKQIKDKKNPK